MKTNKFVKISISTALAAVLFAGCGSSTAPAADAQKSAPVKAAGQQTPTAQSLNTVTGTIRLDKRPVNARVTQSLRSDLYAVTAYNLDTHKSYRTTTNASGQYTLSGLDDGVYQIYAKNDAVAKSAIKRVTLARGTRKVVDFVLQAAGSIKGQIKGAHVVYIPGKDYIAIPDENGNFELTNIPVGTYELAYEVETDNKYSEYDHDNDRTGMMTITVKEGMTDLATITPSFDLFEAETQLPLGTLQLHHEGIRFKLENPWDVDMKALVQNISLEDAAGTKIPVELKYFHENGGMIRTKDIVPAGDYTLRIPASVSDLMDKDFVRTFHVDAVSVAMTENDDDSGARFIRVALPLKLDDTQKATLGTIAVKEKGATDTLPVKAVWSDNEELSLFGNYKTGVEYVLDLTDAQKAIIGQVKTVDEKLTFGSVKLDTLYPVSGSAHIRIDQKIYTNVQNIKELDPSTVKFTVSDGTETKTYRQKDIVFSDSKYGYKPYDGGAGYGYGSTGGTMPDMGYPDYNYFNGHDASVGIRDANLTYGKTYSVTLEAKDIYGNPLSAQSTFSTLTPQVVDLSPQDFEELFRDQLQARFNVDVDKKSGAIAIEDLTDPSQNPMIKIRDDQKDHEGMYDPYYHGYEDPQAIAFEIEGLKPEHQYRVTVSGFKTEDGADIAEKSTEFATPPKMLFIPDEYQQNLFVNPKNFEHKVKFFVFGGLSDAEKEFMKAHLQVTSYGNATTPDATHPERKLFFLDDPDGVEVVAAFTIDPDTNYEISFDDVSGLGGIVMPRGFEAGKPLFSFSTMKTGDQGSGEGGPSAIRNMQVFADGKQGEIDLDVTLPLGEIPQSESCWNLYENEIGSINFAQYVHVEDKEHKQIGIESGDNYNYPNISENYFGERKLCSLQGHMHGWFPVDYNSTYTVTADFSRDFADKGVGGLSLSKMLQTAPLGEMNYWIDDNSGKDAILFHVRANAPIANPDILKVMMDGVEYRPEVPEAYTSGEAGDNYSKTVISDMPDGDIVFELPRPLYSLISFTLEKDDGKALKFVKDDNGTTVERADILATPKKFTESVSPDFMPVEVQAVHTKTTENKFVVAEFNRALRMQDIVTYTDANKTEISDIAFEVKDSDGNSVPIVGVSSEDNRVGFALAQELNSSKSYTLSLKSGKEVQSAFGVQKLKSFSQPIDLTVIDLKDAFVLQRNYTFDLTQPYMLGSTDSRQADYINRAFLVMPVDMAEGVTIDPSKTVVNAHTSYGQNMNADALNVKESVLVQPLTNGYDSVDAEVTLSYLYQNETKTYQKRFKDVNRMNVADLYSISGEGVDALRFDFYMKYPQPITEANFKVYNTDGTPATGVTLSVQVDPNSSNSAVVTFNNLAPDTTYRVDVTGLSAYGNPLPADALVSQVMIQTPAQQ